MDISTPQTPEINFERPRVGGQTVSCCGSEIGGALCLNLEFFHNLSKLGSLTRGAICEQLAEMPPLCPQRCDGSIRVFNRGSPWVERIGLLPIMKHHPSMTQEERCVESRVENPRSYRVFACSLLTKQLQLLTLN